MMTEAEAKTKWCPFGRIAHVNGATANSPAHGDPDLMQTCIASDCMAWRWGRYELVSNSPVEGQDEASGYCGLAGAPT